MLAARTLGITHFDSASLHFLEENILFMIRVAGAFVKNDNNSAFYQAGFSTVTQPQYIMNSTHVNSGKAKQILSTFKLFLKTKPQQTKTVSDTIEVLFITSMCLFNYNSRNRSKMWEMTANLRDTCLLLQTQRHLTPFTSAPLNHCVLDVYTNYKVPEKRLLLDSR